ncbi:hypothetical protein PGTUg99_022784 [Puccinia graminis f. sp. tritici]|uniref:Uncharacterized protein n=1 Tax=Puccinia graminis f. sp. tritici TaxID=56615 RepID=A0A5B0RTK1_PUCGR|nr:hypothetical protein PGTUg99_022784 [Puccinia graminis f. sp. tritici]
MFLADQFFDLSAKIGFHKPLRLFTSRIVSLARRSSFAHFFGPSLAAFLAPLAFVFPQFLDALDQLLILWNRLLQKLDKILMQLALLNPVTVHDISDCAVQLDGTVRRLWQVYVRHLRLWDATRQINGPLRPFWITFARLVFFFGGAPGNGLRKAQLDNSTQPHPYRL